MLGTSISPLIFIEQMNEHMNGRQTSGWIEQVVRFAEMGTWKQGWGQRAGFVEVQWVGGWLGDSQVGSLGSGAPGQNPPAS